MYIEVKYVCKVLKTIIQKSKSTNIGKILNFKCGKMFEFLCINMFLIIHYYLIIRS